MQPTPANQKLNVEKLNSPHLPRQWTEIIGAVMRDDDECKIALAVFKADFRKRKALWQA
jgi:hypothetical protein